MISLKKRNEVFLYFRLTVLTQTGEPNCIRRYCSSGSSSVLDHRQTEERWTNVILVSIISLLMRQHGRWVLLLRAVSLELTNKMLISTDWNCSYRVTGGFKRDWVGTIGINSFTCCVLMSLAPRRATACIHAIHPSTGTCPTKHISIEFEILWKFKTL